jgi:type III restriction enzyme
MADENGEFPIANLNKWEVKVLDREMGRKDCLGWYRNPSRPSADAVAVAWQDGQDGQQNWRRIVFFHGYENDAKASMVDPHGIHLSDALPKLRGLADFAADYGAELHRIEAVAEIDETLRVLDRKDAQVRQSVHDAESAETLYRSKAAADY